MGGGRTMGFMVVSYFTNLICQIKGSASLFTCVHGDHFSVLLGSVTHLVLLIMFSDLLKVHVKKLIPCSFICCEAKPFLESAFFAEFW